MSTELDSLRVENERLKQWVADLHSGMWINCVYCGHRYGPTDAVPATKAQALKDHIMVCPEHPMSRMRAALEEAVGVIRSWHGMRLDPEAEKKTWNLYYEGSPEMKAIREALA